MHSGVRNGGFDPDDVGVGSYSSCLRIVRWEHTRRLTRRNPGITEGAANHCDGCGPDVVRAMTSRSIVAMLNWPVISSGAQLRQPETSIVTLSSVGLEVLGYLVWPPDPVAR